MRSISIFNVQVGMEIGRPIYSDKGQVLVGKGVILTQRMIEGLKARNISLVHITDKASVDIEMTDDVPVELRIEATNSIRDTFEQLSSINSKWTNAIDYLNIEKLQRAIKNLMREIRWNKDVLNLLTDSFVHDNYIFAHSVNVTIYALAMACKLNFNEKQLDELAIGAILHDIGKIKISFYLLNKKGKLTDAEFQEIKRHTDCGFELLRHQQHISLLSAHCAYQHHERIDGSGYPRGLKGNEIHQYAKIMAVADVFDALTSTRSYRKAMLPHEAMEILFVGAGSHFEADLVQTFRSAVASYPVGVTVKLNSGETGVVCQNVLHSPGRPIVRVIKDSKGNHCQKPYEIDLSKNLSLMITFCDAIL